jgi:hypothetical protein
MRPINAFAFEKLAEQVYRTWCIDIDPKLNPIADVARPQFWVNATKLTKGDLIRVRATDGSYDFFLVVKGRTIGGKLAARVSIHSGHGDNLPRYVIDAFQRHSSEMVATSVNGMPLPRVDFVDKIGWRVIGFDNLVASQGHETEAAAMIAMGEYINVFGLKTVSDAPRVDPRTGEVTPEKAAPLSSQKPTDFNVDFATRKKAEEKAKLEARRAADLEQLAQRKRDMEAAKAVVGDGA